MAEELAVVKDVGYGNRDIGRPCLWFTVHMLVGGALQVFRGEDADRVIRESGVYDIKDLEGLPCVVESGGNLTRFVRWPPL